MLRTSIFALTLLCSVPAVALAQPAGVATTQSLADTIADGHYVRRGDTGTAVRELQALLAQRGHAVSVDGFFGPNTEAAVQAFQHAEGLAADGIVGPATLTHLQGGAAPRSTPGLVGAIGGAPGAPVSPPSSSTAVSDAYAASLPWARAAQAAGRHRLIIVFEGLWSYSSDYAQRIYAYQDALRAGQSPPGPAVSGLSFVAKQLIVPNLRRTMATSDLLLLPETSENGDSSIAEQAARAWHQVHGSRLEVVIVGHSFGGYSALRLGNKLRARSIPVAHMLTVDARTTPLNYRHFITPSNVLEHANFFQKSLWMPGYEVQGAQNVRLHTSHGAIPGAPEVVAAYRRMVGP